MRQFQSRLETAAGEMRFLHRYDYEIINGAVEVAVAQICQILSDKRETQTMLEELKEEEIVNKVGGR